MKGSERQRRWIQALGRESTPFARLVAGWQYWVMLEASLPWKFPDQGASRLIRQVANWDPGPQDFKIMWFYWSLDPEDARRVLGHSRFPRPVFREQISDQYDLYTVSGVGWDWDHARLRGRRIGTGSWETLFQ